MSSTTTLPFGGIGNSGMGTYHGEEGFRELSHAKAVFKRHRWFPIGLFYPPYGNLVQRLVLKFYLGSGDPRCSAPRSHRPPTEADMNHERTEFDYVVVGGGSAGCVVASRLSEDPTVSVCLLEAGGADNSMFIHAPAGVVAMLPIPVQQLGLQDRAAARA